MNCLRPFLLGAALAVSPCLGVSALGQTPAPPADRPNLDIRVDPLQPDFTLAALPTTLRMPAGKWAFRVTHRFSRALGEGSFGDLASDFFGFDSGAQIGLELRYGLASGTQVGIHRNSERTIQIFGQHNIMAERDGKPVGLDAIVTFEGRDNLHEHSQGAFGLVISRNAGRRAALYAEPIWVANTSPFAVQGSDNSTLMLGLGARVRIRPSTFSSARSARGSRASIRESAK